MIIKLLADILGVVIEMLMLSYFYRGFLGPAKWDKKYLLALYVFDGIMAFAVSYYIPESSMKTIFYLGIDLLPTVMYRGKIGIKLGLMMSFVAIQLSTEMLAWAMLSAIEFEPNISLNEHGIANYVQGVLFSKFVAFCIIKVIILVPQKKYTHLNRSFLPIFLIMPIATILALYQLAIATYIVQEVSMYQRFTLISFLLVLANLLQFVLAEKQIESEEIKRKMKFNNAQLKLQKQFYRNTEMQEQKMKSFKHDINNLLLVILNLLEQDKIEEAKNNLKYLHQEMTFTQSIYTGQAEIDAVLNIKQENCKALGIDLKINSSEIVSFIKINPMDMVVILANCLDNAIEATNQTTTQNKMIRCRIQVDEDHIIIYVSNPVDKPVEITDGKYIMTTKADSSEHGLGLSNIRKVVEKYQGTLNLESTNDTFIFKAMLYNESEDNKA